MSAAPTLFIDRDTWSHLLDSELRAAGVPFVAHRQLFKPATPDVEWIGEVGALTSGNLSAADTVAAIIKAWPAIQREISRTPAPALFSVSRSGEVRLLKSYYDS